MTYGKSRLTNSRCQASRPRHENARWRRSGRMPHMPPTAEPFAACSRCGTENPAGALFCSHCGAELAAAAAQEERKLVSVLFVDLVDFTAQSDRADPEDIRDILEVYHSMVRGRGDEYG